LANRSIITKKILNYRELLSDLLPENIEKNSSTHQNLTIKNESSNFYDTDSVFITQPEFNRSSLSDNLNSCSSQKSTSASNPEISSYSSSINKNLYNTADNIPDFVSPSHPSPKEDLDKSSTSINIDESIKSHDPISLIGGRDLNNKTDSTSNEINQINLISDLDDDFFDCLDFESLEALAVQNSQLQPNIIENHTLPDKNIPSPKKVGNTASITRKNSTDTDNNNNIEILDNEIDSFDDIEDLAQLELKLQEIEKNSSISTIPPKNKKPSDLVNEDHEAALLDILESQYIGRTSNDWEYSTCEKFLTVAVRSADEDFSFNSSSEKIIVAISEETQKEVIIQLQDLWSQTQIFEGDLFNVLPALTLGYDSCPEKNKQQNHFVFNKHTNYLFILHPDELIPATMLAGAFPCQRRAVLKSKFKSQVIEDLLKTNQDPEKKIYDLLLIGNITHSLFQYAAVNDVWSEDLLDEALDKILVDNIQEIWNIKSDLETIKSKMAPKISKIIEFASNYIYGYKKNSSTSSQFFKHPSILKKPFADKIPEKKNSLNIYKVVDFEENVRSPRLGLKGNIDMTVLGSFSKPFEQKKFEIIPFEIKSGKPGNSSQSSHTAQLLIYTLLLSERYKMNVKHGVLSYITYGDLFVVKQDINYIKELICTRNNLALYLNTKEHTTIRLPPMVGKVYTCKNCPVASVCFLTHKAIEGGTHLTSKVPEEFWYSQVGELTQKGLDFYKRWTNLIENEEFESKSSLSEMWTLTPEERASKGDCILDMEVLDCANFFFDTNYGTNLKSKVRFGKRDKKGKLLNLVHHFQVGDHMVVSRESETFGMSIGTVYEIEQKSILVALDRKIYSFISEKNKNSVNHQDSARLERNIDIEDIISSPEQVTGNGSTIRFKNGSNSYKPIKYRIDRGSIASSNSSLRTNLAALFINNGDADRRRLIVDLEPPSFSHATKIIPKTRALRLGLSKKRKAPSQSTLTPISSTQNPSYPESYENNVFTQLEGLNIAQQSAANKIKQSNDYAMILGMPGTGKTTTITQIVKQLVKSEKSILLVSYTNTAVDNILLRLNTDECPFLRLGSIDKVHQSVVKHTLFSIKPQTIEEVDKLLMQTPIIATTCLSINHPVFRHRRFDYCIIDEASQITLPACIGPLRFCERFVLVGDHFQLPPLIKSKTNSMNKLDDVTDSLFKILCDAHPIAVAELDFQFRMNSEIQSLSNKLIYSNRLKCGSAETSIRRLKLPKFPIKELNISSLERSKLDIDSILKVVNSFSGLKWLNSVIDPSLPVVFINTDTLLSYSSFSETRTGTDSVCNSGESKLVALITCCLLKAGLIKDDEIGVISPYRAQLKLLRTDVENLISVFFNENSNKIDTLKNNSEFLSQSNIKITGTFKPAINKPKSLSDSNQSSIVAQVSESSQFQGSAPKKSKKDVFNCDFSSDNNSDAFDYEIEDLSPRLAQNRKNMIPPIPINQQIKPQQNSGAITNSDLGLNSNLNSINNLMIEIDTIDRYQGRDKQAILLSWVTDIDPGIAEIISLWN
ncbi:DNA replication ATP-dependent helicase/nuclease DNA2, partial [Smittium culicis]